MPASIFQGDAVKILKDKLRSKSNIEIITGDTDDPTSVAKDAPASSLYLRSGTAEVYVKSDSGSSTNWNLLSTSAVVTYDVISVAVNTNMVNEKTYLVNSGSGTYTMTLPDPSTSTYVRIKDSGFNANTNNITVARNGSENIEGAASNFTMDSDGEAAVFVSDGTNWFKL
jgi:hypothetical protein